MKYANSDNVPQQKYRANTSQIPNQSNDLTETNHSYFT